MNKTSTAGMYLAVLPSYRRDCIALLTKSTPHLRLFCADAHLNKSVKTGIPASLYTRTHMVRFAGKGFLQVGSWCRAIGLGSLIVDLNPRSATAWLLLLTRRALRRRTVVWGHLYPRGGRDSGGASRSWMRRLANGTVCYTYDQADQARQDMPTQRVWVAPNALYRRETLVPGALRGERNCAIYVGRLESEKRVDHFIRAFASTSSETTRALIVGFGSEEKKLRDLAEELGVAERCDFLGRIESPSDLAECYARSFCAVSPGFAGLGLTQALGFGVPMVVTEGLHHSPEVELARDWPQSVIWVDDDVQAFAGALDRALQLRDSLPHRDVQDDVARRYSAEAMAAGLLAALHNTELEQEYQHLES